MKRYGNIYEKYTTNLIDIANKYYLENIKNKRKLKP